MSKPKLVISLCLAVLMLVLAIGAASQAQTTSLIYQIGVIDNERGPLSNGVRLALQEINARGGITTTQGTNIRLELVVAPIAQLTGSEAAVTQLAAAGVEAIIGPAQTDAVLESLPLLQSLDIPILTPATGDLLIASDTSGNLFRIRAAERLQSEALANYLVNRVNARQIISVQLDLSSLGEQISFLSALSRQPQRVDRTVLRYEDDEGLATLVATVLQRDPQVVTVFGPPRLTSQFYIQLRAAGWVGLFAYNQATSPAFVRSVPLAELYGILSTITWSLDTPTSRSRAFVNSFVDGFDETPGPLEAAAYDAIYLIAAALRTPGELSANLQQVRDFAGVQGVLNRARMARGEMSDTVAVIQLNAQGGTDLRLRYASGSPIDPEPELVATVTLTPQPTATREGVFLTIMSSVQNVRSGPGLIYPVVGQLLQGQTARVLGTAADGSWVVINFNGQLGWLASYLLQLTGDLRTVPVVPAPPPPTPTPTPIASPVPIYIAIQSPLPGNLVAGSVPIIGSALHPGFLQYQLDFAPSPNTQGVWTPIAIAQTPVVNGVLGIWNTSLIGDGLYQIRLTVVLQDGTLLSTVVGDVRVQNRIATPVPTATPVLAAPIAAFVPDRTAGEAPLTVRFINQSSGNIAQIQWNFGDGTTSTETSPTHTFANPGIYTVTLQVSGPGGASNFSWQINVRTQSAPIAGFSQSVASGRAPLTVQFTDQSVGSITNWVWNFSDGTTSTERNPSHTFSGVGTYNVFLTVSGPGGSSVASRQVTVENPTSPPPTALFAAAPTSGAAPLTVQFTNQSTGNMTAITWNFGDGTLSSDQNPSHTFTAPGVYTVTLYATGPGGNSIMQANITVNAPTLTPTPTFTLTRKWRLPLFQPIRPSHPQQPLPRHPHLRGRLFRPQ